MAEKPKKRVLKAAPKEPFPWWPLLLLIATVGLFWVWPRQIEDGPVRVNFASKAPSR